jgi:hypothetical protein
MLWLRDVYLTKLSHNRVGCACTQGSTDLTASRLLVCEDWEIMADGGEKNRWNYSVLFSLVLVLLLLHRCQFIVVYLKMLIIAIADHSGRAVYGINCLRSLEHWDRGFEAHSSHGCLCACSGLAMGWSPVQGVLPAVYRVKKQKKRQRSNKRTVEP